MVHPQHHQQQQEHDDPRDETTVSNNNSNNNNNIGIKSRRRVDVTLKLPQLQNLCKRDADGYKEEYLAQKRRLQSEVEILLLQPQKEPSKSLVELVQFCAAVSSASYKGAESDSVATMLLHLLGVKSTICTTSTSSTSATAAASIPNTTNRNNSSNNSNMLLLHRQVRKTCVSALILMRNKGAIPPLPLLQAFFSIMSVAPEKGLRTQLFKHLVNDVRNLNKTSNSHNSHGSSSSKKRNDQVNRSIQSFLHRIVATSGNSSNSGDGSSDHHQDDASGVVVAAKKATDMVCELYRHAVWTDARAVAIVAQAVQSPHATVSSRAVRFFLKIEENMASDEQHKKEQEEAAVERIDYHAFSRKTKTHVRQTARQLKKRKKVILKQQANDEAANLTHVMEHDKGVEASKKLYPAIELLRDPQGLAEHVLKRLRSASSGGNNNKSSVKFETKLLLLNFVTRLVGNHELQLLPLYPYLQRYLHTHQRNVTEILVYCVQASHEYVPPEEVVGLLKTIAHQFITERCSEEEMAVGINAARAICARVPATLSVTTGTTESESGGSGGMEHDGMDMPAFCRDLAAYSKHRDRSVAIAAKAWTNFLRETCPSMLQGKHRGLKGTALLKHSSAAPLRFGESHAATGVEGADLLAEYEAKKAKEQKRQAAAAAAAAGEEEEDEDKEPSANDEDDEWTDDDDDEHEEKAADESDDEAPQLVNLDKAAAASAEDGDGAEDDDDDDKKQAASIGDKDEDEVLDLAKMSVEERNALKQEMSSTRIFTTSDFIKMRKLVERENRAKRDPREAARRKRALARNGTDFEALSDDDDNDDDNDSDDSDEEEQIQVAGVVNPTDLMALSKRKRQSKAEKLQKILSGRTKFEAKSREGGSTNVEKKRRKNFVLTKFSQETRAKNSGKGSLTGRGGAFGKGKRKKQQLSHDAKKRRRKM